MRKPLIAAVALSALMAWGSRAEAQRGVDSELFHPALDSYGIFTVDRSQTSKAWDFGFKLFLNYAQNPLRLGMCPLTSTCSLASANPKAPGLQAIMNYQAVLNFGIHLGLTDWLEFVVDLPVSAQSYSAEYGSYGSASDPNISRTGFYSNGNFTNVPPPNAAPLDWRVGFKARLFRSGIFGMGLSAVVTLPFGDDAAFLGDADFTFRPTLIADVTRGPFTAAINLGAIVRKETIIYSPNDPVQAGTTGLARPRSLIDVSDELTWSAGVAYRFVHWAGVAAEVFGLIPLVTSASTPLDAGKDFTADVLGGFQFFPVRDVAVGVGAGAGVITTSERHDDFRVFGGITWAPSEGNRGGGVGGGIDSDGDGIPDASDLCPTEPEDKDGFDDEDGCPDLDNDQDGIADKNDKCPNEAEDCDGYQDEDGCPDIDNDGDGIPDAQDKCPNDPEDKDGFQDDDGCPDPRQRRRRHPRLRRQVPERAGDVQRHRRQRRLPRFRRRRRRRHRHQRRQDRAAREHPVRGGLGSPHRPLASVGRARGREDEGQPASEAHPRGRPHGRRRLGAEEPGVVAAACGSGARLHDSQGRRAGSPASSRLRRHAPDRQTQDG